MFRLKSIVPVALLIALSGPALAAPVLTEAFKGPALKKKIKFDESILYPVERDIPIPPNPGCLSCLGKIHEQLIVPQMQ